MSDANGSTASTREWPEEPSFDLYFQRMLNQQLEGVKREMNERISNLEQTLRVEHVEHLKGTEQRLQTVIRDSFSLRSPALTPPVQHTPPPPPKSGPDEEDYKAQIKELQRQLAAKTSECNDLKAKSDKNLQMLQRELEQEQRKTLDAQATVAALRIMAPNGTLDVVLDSEICEKFRQVRWWTQRVVATLYTADKIGRIGVDESKKFFDELGKTKQKLWKHRIWAELYVQLQALFYTNWLQFGLGEKYQQLHLDLSTAENSLYEALNKGYPGGKCFCRKEIVQWRHATLRCADLLSGTHDSPTRYYMTIRQYFEPVRTSDKKDLEKGDARLKKLCDEWYALMMLMRRAHDSFNFFMPKTDMPVVGYEQSVEEIITEGSESEKGERVIKGCLFGGLFKRSHDNPNERITLEKAHVVVATKVPKKDVKEKNGLHDSFCELEDTRH
ncbi:hypothetical protein NM208_g14769 [Fusarium decemcellulare]|uniref:Uncharacterized protein n=1 Tax=Fusarium decemcellulare TaxID=57161 RepID=A0ACC1RG54_9HYPO|nr:hypothetical protein NM208_g14769 [Fusarium decemcellulare]